MRSKNIRSLLIQLHQELVNSSGFSDEELRRFQQLRKDIDVLLESEKPECDKRKATHMSLFRRIVETQRAFTKKSAKTDALFDEITQSFRTMGV